MTGPVEGVGWPFLVAAGRVRDHTVIVAPEGLVASGEYGALETVDGSGPPTGSSESPTRAVILAGGRALAVCCRTRPLTAQDLTAAPVTGVGSDVVRDEHNRPLRALVGVVVQDPSAGVSDVDLEVAWSLVLPAYRLFLENELAFTVSPSTAMPVTGARCPVAQDVPVPYAASTRSPSARPPVRIAGVLVPAVLAVVVVAGALALHPWSQDTPVTPTPTVTTTTTAATTVTRAGPP